MEELRVTQGLCLRGCGEYTSSKETRDLQKRIPYSSKRKANWFKCLMFSFVSLISMANVPKKFGESFVFPNVWSMSSQNTEPRGLYLQCGSLVNGYLLSENGPSSV